MQPKFSIAQPRLHEAHGLSYRQLQCLAWVHEGKSANDIGLILGISGRTVEKHLRRACEHLGVRSRIQAVVRARDLGFLVAPVRLASRSQDGLELQLDAQCNDTVTSQESS